MIVRDRIRDLRRVRASELIPNPRNWRTHPEAQQNAIRGMLAEIGYADALLVRELPDGSLELVDGHLRAETTPDQQVPVLVLDISEDEANKLLALFDPLTSMAEIDAQKFDELIRGVQTGNEALAALLAQTAEAAGLYQTEDEPSEPEPTLSSRFEVVVECDGESHQREVFERLSAEGLRCRVLLL